MTRDAPRQPVARAYTLLELLVAMSISVVLVGAATSVVVLSSHAIPSSASGDTVGSSWQSGRALNRILNELRYAQYFTEVGRSTVAFTVPDRDMDGRPERIRYHWSGEPGAALERTYNDQGPITLVQNVTSLAFDYHLDVTTEEIPGAGEITSNETSLAQFTTEADTSDVTVDDTELIGQYIKPTVPGIATSWTLTSLQAKVKQIRAGVNTELRIYRVDENFKPTGSALATETIRAADLPEGDFGWHLVGPLDLPDFAPGEGICFVFASFGINESIKVRYDRSGGAGMLLSSNGGASWTHHGDRSVLYVANGTINVAPISRVITRRFVNAVDVELEAADAAPLVAGVPTLNTPELLEGYWETQFTDDPTWIDLNGDGEPDWNAFGAAYNEADRTGGAWSPSSISGLATEPQHAFTRVTTVDLRLRLTEDATDGAMFMLNGDWADSTLARIMAKLSRSGGTQILVLSDQQSESTERVLATVTDIPDGFVDITLHVDPGAQIVHLVVNGADHASFSYDKFAPSSPATFALTMSQAAGVEWDLARIRSGGVASDQVPTTVVSKNVPPIAVADVEVDGALVGEAVTFDGSASSDPDGDALTFTWFFGGRHVAYGKTVEHVFEDPGYVSATLIVSDGAGGVADDSVWVVVGGK